MGKFQRYLLMPVITVALCCAEALAQFQLPVAWVPAESTYNGMPFVDLGNGQGRTPDTDNVNIAYGRVHGNAGERMGIFRFTSNQDQFASYQNTELAATPLSAGTDVRLVFRSTGNMRPRTITVLSDGAASSAYEKIDDTTFRIRTNIIDPVAGQYGDAQAGFAIALEYEQADTSSDDPDPIEAQWPYFFVTNAHPMAVSMAMTIWKTGTVATGTTGQNGINTDVYAFLPLPFVAKLGPTLEAAAQRVTGYINDAPTALEHLGFRSDLGFSFQDAENPDNTIYRVKLSSAALAPGSNGYGATVAFGSADTTPPVVSGLKKIYQGRRGTATITFKVKDASRVAGQTVYFGYFDKDDRGEQGSAVRTKVKPDGSVKAAIKRLKRGTTRVSMYVSDAFGNKRAKGFSIKN